MNVNVYAMENVSHRRCARHPAHAAREVVTDQELETQNLHESNNARDFFWCQTQFFGCAEARDPGPVERLHRLHSRKLAIIPLSEPGHTGPTISEGQEDHQMLSLIQRVAEARVRIDEQVVGEIGQGLLVLVCAEQGDTREQADALLNRILKLRIFADAEGRMNRSVQDVGGGLLIVSQFTLAADTRRGNRPGFSRAAAPAEGRALYEYLLEQARTRHPVVGAGEFGANMQVHLVNDGPVTIPLNVPPAGGA